MFLFFPQLQAVAVFLGCIYSFILHLYKQLSIEVQACNPST